jgi:hypothetical protein
MDGFIKAYARAHDLYTTAGNVAPAPNKSIGFVEEYVAIVSLLVWVIIVSSTFLLLLLLTPPSSRVVVATPCRRRFLSSPIA